jgi:hypothetical protein
MESRDVGYAAAPYYDDDIPRDLDDEPLWLMGGMGGGPYPLLGRGSGTGLTCGGCKEFVEDGDGGRGTCLHPGSGIAFPWTDTPGCDFHSRRR